MKLERHNISEAPRMGTGLHDWILKVSRELLLAGYSKGVAFELMSSRSRGKGRNVDREIEDALDGAAQWIEDEQIEIGDRQSGGYIDSWEDIQYRIANYSAEIEPQDKREEYCELDLEARREAIDYGKQPDEANGCFAWPKLFCLNEINLCFTKLCKPPLYFYSYPLGKWKPYSRLERFGYMVPSPMFKAGEGYKGIKTDINTTRRMYQIIEFDTGTLEEQWCLLGWLEDQFRELGWFVAMVVFSGNKSLHAWFPCYHLEEYDIRTFFRAATKLGADRSHRIPSQLCRVPRGWNYKTERRQGVLYWNEAIIEEHNDIIRKDLL